MTEIHTPLDPLLEAFKRQTPPTAEQAIVAAAESINRIMGVWAPVPNANVRTYGSVERDTAAADAVAKMVSAYILRGSGVSLIKPEA